MDALSSTDAMRIGNISVKRKSSLSRRPIANSRPLSDSVVTRALGWTSDRRGRGFLIGVDLEAATPCVLFTGSVDLPASMMDGPHAPGLLLERFDALGLITRVPLANVYGIAEEPDLDDRESVSQILDAAAVFALNQPAVTVAQALLFEEQGDGPDGTKKGDGKDDGKKADGGKKDGGDGGKDGEKGGTSSSKETGTVVKGKVKVEVKKKVKKPKPTKPGDPPPPDNETNVTVEATGEVEVHKSAAISQLWGLVNCKAVKNAKSIKVKGTITITIHLVSDEMKDILGPDGKPTGKQEPTGNTVETDINITVNADVEIDVIEEVRSVVEGILGKETELTKPGP